MATDLDYKKKMERLVGTLQKLVSVPENAKLEDEERERAKRESETEPPTPTDEQSRGISPAFDVW